MHPLHHDRSESAGIESSSASSRLSAKLGWIQWISAAAAILIALLILYSSRHERNTVVEQLRERNRLKMQAAKDHIEDYVGKIHMCLRTMSHYPHVLEKNAQSTAYLHAIFEANYAQRHVLEIYVIQSDFMGHKPPLHVFEMGDDEQDVIGLHTITREAAEYAVHLE
ncbi:MAG: hypothetical protein ACE5EQ_11300, partial [Phycisphaerae bacterium]